MSILDRILGRALPTASEEEQKVGVFAGIPMLGLDALSSAAYGPEAALTILIPLGAYGLRWIGPIIAIILVILGLLCLSYRQTIEAYPGGGGSYTVASKNLGAKMGLLAGAALLLDYVLNVAVGISAGVGALVSAVPKLQPHTLACCLVILALIALVNLRGTRESGSAFALPTYLFVGTLGLVICIGIERAIAAGGHPIAVERLPAVPAATSAAGLWILMRSFASGCTAMTGVEAVSNGVSAFAKPSVKNAQRTLLVIVLILSALLAGIGYLAHVYGIAATDPSGAGYQSIISMLVGAVVGRGAFYYITLASVLAVLALSANTSFADFPRLCRLIAEDDYLPHSFANRGRRLVYSMGISILTLFSGLLLIAFGGITDRLIPLFAIGAFLAFTLSQTGMVWHWKRIGGVKVLVQAILNGAGAIATAAALVVILVAKFAEGAWITVLLIPACMALFAGVKRHYRNVEKETCCDRPMNVSDLSAPLVVVPVKRWTIITEKALRFGMRISEDVVAVHVTTGEDDENALRESWKRYVEEPLGAEKRRPPELEVIASPYRKLLDPLFGYLKELRLRHPDRLIAVIVPELVESHWYQYPLHNQRATWLKAALLLTGDRRIVVINVPWFIGPHRQIEAEEEQPDA